ncbi:MAG: S-layer protein [Limnothrix sp. CACIAM 69d]|nr:MAG: S-layer protein [Limnothrix sp. CACIAM 69d]
MTAAALETDSETDSETKAATAIPQLKMHQPMHQPPIGAITASGRSRQAGGFRSRAMVRSVLGSLLGALVGLLAGTSGVVAQTLEAIDPTGTDPIDPETAIPAQAQVTSVSALSDVQPTDWAFQALQSLVERYGCLAGYPDGLFRGDRPLGRFEFAAGLAACLEAIQTQLDRATDAAVQRDDQAALSRLQTEFRSELEQLTGRVNRLETTTARLESQRFSPTLLMGGETIFGLSAAAGDNPPGDNENPATFAHLTRLQFVTSFTGKDRLRLQLATGNLGNNGYASRQSLGTDMARLSFQTDLDNNIQLDLLDYRFAAWGDRVVLTLRPVGFDLSSVLTANSPFFDTGRGAISRFAEGSPLFKLAALDGGVGADWLLWERGRLQFAYGAGNSARSDQGIFGSDRSAWGVQLLTKPAATLLTGIAYINAYDDRGYLNTFTGSLNADLSGKLDSPAQIHGLSGTLQWRLSEALTLAAWGGWVWTNYIDREATALSNTYAVSLAWSDPFGREGDLWAFLVGQPLRLVKGTGDVEDDSGQGMHLETFYRLKVGDRISITPGVFVVTQAEHEADRGAIVVGTIRTTFRF